MQTQSNLLFRARLRAVTEQVEQRDDSTPAPAGDRERESSPSAGGAKSANAADRLSHYGRSLLKIQVPVAVTLAEKRQPVSRILELGPGSIIQFNKSCEEMLELVVGNQTVAVGEAVKVGDKFGIRLTSMAAPEERFQPVQSKPKQS